MLNMPRSVESLKSILPENKNFCLVGGVFDLIHVGHLHLLEYAASLEDILVVAVLSDKYVRGYKDPDRPIIAQAQRAMMVAALRCVDYAYIADVSPNSSRVLSLLQPHSVVFGEDAQNADRIAERTDRVHRCSPMTHIRTLPRYKSEDISTEAIIRKIRG